MLRSRLCVVTTQSAIDLPQLENKSLETRNVTPELMDDPGLERSEHLRALKALGRINWLSRTARSLAREMEHVLGPVPDRKIRVLDMACGSGDIILPLQRLLLRQSIEAEIDGCDASPVAIDFAAFQAEMSGSRAQFFLRNVLKDPLPEGYDLIISSLFLHHLRDAEIPALLSKLANSAELGFVISDLVRSRLGYWMAYLASMAVTRSAVVRVDSLLSVRSALTISEIDSYMFEAGLNAGSRVYRCFPCRFISSWRRA